MCQLVICWRIRWLLQGPEDAPHSGRPGAEEDARRAILDELPVWLLFCTHNEPSDQPPSEWKAVPPQALSRPPENKEWCFIPPSIHHAYSCITNLTQCHPGKRLLGDSIFSPTGSAQGKTTLERGRAFGIAVLIASSCSVVPFNPVCTWHSQ